MIQPSPELAAIAGRWLQAIQNRDAAALRNLVADSDQLSFVGTSDNEFWTGRRVRDGLSAHFREIPPITSENLHVEAYEAGEIGWAFYSFKMSIENRQDPVIGRTTLVFILQDGNWRIIHRHSSFPRPNTEIHGSEMHALDDLMRAVRTEGALDGTTGIASVMFTDVVGSSILAESLGDRRWAEVIRDHLDLVRLAVAAQGGQLVKSLGDGTMSAFPSARTAMTAARDIQRRLADLDEEPRLQVRTGIHTGDVMRAGEDFFGTVVNKAARLTGVAQPGEILISEVTRMMAGATPDLVFGDPVTTELRGLDGVHVHYRLVWS